MINVNINLDRAGKLDHRSEEAYKNLRTNISFCGEEVKVIAITSCTPNEGKSSVSFNLAVSMAEAGNRVLFMDADLRKSVLMGRYKINKAIKGLTHFLADQEKFEDVACNTNIENLHVVFSGPVPPNPAELLGKKKFKLLLAELRKAYDYIIIDTPPLGSVIDAAVVAEQCDGAVMVIQTNTISYKFAQKIKIQLEKANCKILGVVLNKVDMKKNGYYGKYYGKYYGQYYGTYGSSS